MIDRAVCAILAGFLLDLLAGDPHWLYHPVRLVGKLISATEKNLRRWFPKTDKGERLAGFFLVLIVSGVTMGVPSLLLWLVSRWGRPGAFIIETILCYQLFALRSLKEESMKVYHELKHRNLSGARKAVSMIVGRDTENLDEAGVTRAAVETVAENTSDGIVAPLLFLAIGGAPLGFFYKAVNTMDSMLGYVEMPYKHIGLVPAKMDDVMNFIPSRLSALLMLLAGGILRLDVKNGWKIFQRDRYNHASPNSAQTESVCAGLLGLRLAGDAYYHGQLHKKKYIGDALREVEYEDIPRSCRLLYVTAMLSLILFGGLKFLFLVVI